MGMITIRCPATRMPVGTGITMNRAAFEDATLENITIGLCPECGADHTWSKTDVPVGP
jgi:hypothetical protein